MTDFDPALVVFLLIFFGGMAAMAVGIYFDNKEQS